MPPPPTPEPTDRSTGPKPAGPETRPYREITWAAVLLGIAQGIVLNVAFVYVALRLGFSLGGSAVAAIMGYALLRGVLRRGSMAENNINQTIASGINTGGTGVVFTVPALFLLNAARQAGGDSGVPFQILPLLIAGVAGAVLGVVAIIPLRKQMIELDRLRFPTGVATATIIRAGSAGTEKAVLLAVGFVLSAAWKLWLGSGRLDTPGWVAEYGLGVLHEELYFGFHAIPAYCAPVISLSLMNLAAGMLAGRGGLPFLAGGVIAWWLVSPAAVSLGWTPPAADAVATSDFVYAQMLRPLGIGVLIGGALMGVVTAFPAIRSALRSLASAARTAGAGRQVGGDELQLGTLLAGTLAALGLFFFASWMTPGVSLFQAALSAVVGTLWLGLAALIVAQATGLTDISPMSGMSLISVTLMMVLLNHNIAAAMVVGVAVCVAIGQGADMMQDLKTGFLIGARPIRQQTVQLATTWIGPLVAMAAVSILWAGGPGGANGFGNRDLPAPQGGALMAMIDSVSSGQVPIDKYALGGVVGGLLGAAPASGLGVLVGLAMYLPFSITLGYGLGCLLQMAIQRVRGAAFCEHRLVPFAAGLIVGEAIMGMLDALWKVAGPWISGIGA